MSLAGALSIVACNTVAGLDELTFTAGSGAAGGGQQGGGGASGSCDLEPVPDACAECTYDECNEDYCDCMADGDCVALYDCLSSCLPGDTSCHRSCFQQYPGRISLASLLVDCSTVHCPSCPPSTPLTGCDECLFRHCPEAMNECLADSECLDFMICYFDCLGDAECTDGCVEAYPAATPLFLPVYACGQTACSSPCA